MDQIQWEMKSRMGTFYLVVSEMGLEGVFWKKQPIPKAESLKGQNPRIQTLSQSVHQLEEYFQGKLQKFDLPIHLTGTVFQRKVWDQVSKIPYGQTASYLDIAKKIGNQQAARAVGTANGRNPLSIIVPCHRVIATDGSLGGYSGGLKLKSKLLVLEQKQHVTEE